MDADVYCFIFFPSSQMSFNSQHQASVAHGHHHHLKDKNNEEEVVDEDPYISRIRRSGCYAQHVALQDCYLVLGGEDGKTLSTVRDWRKCRREMEAFKQCFQAQKQAQKQQEQ